ncbi:hypothetical protein Agub_g10826, partial [Astrephomene gubernaculifera]
SSRPAAAGNTAAAAAGPPTSKTGRRTKRVDFQLPEEDDDDEEDGNRASAQSDDDASGGPVEDDTKPLGWSYFRKRDASEGPVSWDEVDVEELRFVAESLVRSTTTRASQPDDDVIHQIFQEGGPGESDELVSDPLGRGFIDPVTLTLGKKSKMSRQVPSSGGEKGLNATMRTFRTARLTAKQQQTQASSGGAEGSPGGSGQAGPASPGLDEETRKVLPNQEGFEPEAYLATFHADTSMSQLEKGLRALSRELSERTGQLKLLIRNNFDRFISCKDAIDDIHAKLRRMLVRGGGGGGGAAGSAAAAGGSGGSSQPSAALSALQQQQQGVGTERVFRSLEQVEANARRTFGPILERATRADRLRAVSGLLQRFDHLFALPQRVLELASRGELEQVVREYRRVNMLIRPTATTARVWISLYAEIEKRITEVYMVVKQLVSEPPPEGRPMGQDGPASLFAVTPSGAASAVGGSADRGDDSTQERLHHLPDYLLFMTLVRQERLPVARDEDAMRLYVSRLAAHVEERIQACDKRHTEQLGQLVTLWMKATAGPAGAGSSSSSSGAGASSTLSQQMRPAASAIASLQASIASVGAKATADSSGQGTGQGQRNGRTDGEGRTAAELEAGGGEGTEEGDEDDEEDGDSLDEEAEAAEAVFLLWPGVSDQYAGAAAATASASSLGTAPLPYHIRRELPRLVQDPGGSSGGVPPAASTVLTGFGLYDDVVNGRSMLMGGGGSASASDLLLPQQLPASAHAPEPQLTPGQRQWVSYVCSVSALLLWSLPGLWATCNSPKYGSHADLDEQSREGLQRGTSLARRMVESLCGKYVSRLRRAVQSLVRAGAMQPGLPLLIKDACHLWSSLRRVGVSGRTLAVLRGGVLAALGSHVRLLGRQLGELPGRLLAADDFRLDLLAADQQPLTVLPRRLEEELGVALLHFHWPLRAVVEAAGGVEEVPPEPGWKPMQSSVFACFSLLSEAMAEYARGLYGRTPGRSAAGSGAGDGAHAAAGPNRRRVTFALSEGGSSPRSNNDAGDDTQGAISGGGIADDGTVTRGSLWAAATSGSGEDVRLLLVISNSAVIRTRVMPGVVERYRRILAPTPDAASTCSRRLRDLTSSMRRANEALGATYLARKEATLAAAVRRYVAEETAGPQHGQASLQQQPAAAVAEAGGAGGGAPLLAGPAGPSGGCCALLQLLTATHNEALAYSPSNLRSFMEALAEHLVEQLGRAHQLLAAAATHAPSTAAARTASGSKHQAGSGGGGASVEQVVQLWADAAFLAEVLRPLLSASLVAELEEAKVVLGSAIAARQRSRRYRPASTPAAAVAGLRDGEAISAALQELLGGEVQAWLRRHALNVRCFAAAAATSGGATAASAAAAVRGPAGNTKGGAAAGAAPSAAVAGGRAQRLAAAAASSSVAVAAAEPGETSRPARSRRGAAA